MKCPACGSVHTATRSRVYQRPTKRTNYRVCRSCGTRFSTTETVKKIYGTRKLSLRHKR